MKLTDEDIETDQVPQTETTETKTTPRETFQEMMMAEAKSLTSLKQQETVADAQELHQDHHQNGPTTDLAVQPLLDNQSLIASVGPASAQTLSPSLNLNNLYHQNQLNKNSNKISLQHILVPLQSNLSKNHHSQLKRPALSSNSSSSSLTNFLLDHLQPLIELPSPSMTQLNMIPISDLKKSENSHSIIPHLPSLQSPQSPQSTVYPSILSNTFHSRQTSSRNNNFFFSSQSSHSSPSEIVSSRSVSAPLHHHHHHSHHSHHHSHQFGSLISSSPSSSSSFPSSPSSSSSASLSTTSPIRSPSSSSLNTLTINKNLHPIPNSLDSQQTNLNVFTFPSSPQKSPPSTSSSSTPAPAQSTPSPSSPASTFHHSTDPQLTELGNEFGFTDRIISQTSGTNYHLKRVLGQGSFSKVIQALIIKDGTTAEFLPGKVALKMVRIKKSPKHSHSNMSNSENDRICMSVLREVEILKSIDHPTIIKLFETFTMTSKSSAFSSLKVLALEEIEGGELFELVTQYSKNLRGLVVCRLMSELLISVDWLHSLGIVHRDLKLENVLVIRGIKNTKEEEIEMLENPQVYLKITDFGLSRKMEMKDSIKLLKTRCGSEEYAAPEIILGRKYDGRKTDGWALGVIGYSLVMGHLPFHVPEIDREHPDTEGVRLRKRGLTQIVKGEYSWDNDHSDHEERTEWISRHKNLVSKLLNRDPNMRCQIEDAFKDSEWVGQFNWLRKLLNSKSHYLVPADPSANGPSYISDEEDN
ncbi:hypothetical protein O181_046822 [Austropuccinia psidii MF-1]|uniref:Protein kinase domain-containing protein n=1 Tax=Austropuccinia psidii MF-1 TaxID=1389203 RepID=A0A9Q3DWP1_9BASI|nr:hypothetical protein [Austropuccinia psidii MF-1]